MINVWIFNLYHFFVTKYRTIWKTQASHCRSGLCTGQEECPWRIQLEASLHKYLKYNTHIYVMKLDTQQNITVLYWTAYYLILDRHKQTFWPCNTSFKVSVYYVSKTITYTPAACPNDFISQSKHVCCLKELKDVFPEPNLPPVYNMHLLKDVCVHLYLFQSQRDL